MIRAIIEEGSQNDSFAAARALGRELAEQDAIRRAQSLTQLIARSRAGETILISTHDERLIETSADELHWVRNGTLLDQGDPNEVLQRYRAHVAKSLVAAGSGVAAAVSPSLRGGDGRAELQSIELRNAAGAAASVFASGDEMTVRVTVRFAQRVEDPVVGILIRTRIGLNVYGTNTELEHLKLGPAEAGSTRTVSYRFRCQLCPGDYTITAASHDPDGVWHDWLEDAVAFAVSDTRYTAGVANLRAEVMAE